MFAAIVMRGSRDAPQDYAAPDALLDALTPYDQADATGTWQEDRATLIQALTWNTPESRHESVPERCAETGRVIASWIRLDNRAALCAALRLTEGPELTDPQIVLAAHRAWGKDCVDRLEGDFSFVLHDPARGETLLARDPLGARPLYYHLDDDVLICATSLAAFHRVRRLALSPTQDWAIRYIAWFVPAGDRTAFETVRKLPAAHLMTVRAEGAAVPERYFAFDLTAPNASARDDKRVEAYRSAFHDAVAHRMRSAYPLGAENSGGLDSASILANMVSRMEDGPRTVWCFGQCDHIDEPDYLMAVPLMYRIANTYVNLRRGVSPDPAILDRAFRVLGTPPDFDLPLFHAPFYAQAARNGVRTLMSGYGGDEFVTSSAATLRTELHHARQWRALYAELDGNRAMRALRVGRRFLSQPASARPGTASTAMLRRILRDDVVAAHPVGDHDTHVHGALGAAKTVNAVLMAKAHLNRSLEDRTDTNALIAGSYGVEMRWPLLDRRLIQLYLSTPAIEKRKGALGRYLHRRAVAGTIPDRIAWRRSKLYGAGPVWINDTDVPLQRSWSELPPLLQDIVDPAKLDREVAAVRAHHDPKHRSEHAYRRKLLLQLEVACIWLDSADMKKGL
jgi:asparagine synthase (glutamine-hydrolysing)